MRVLADSDLDALIFEPGFSTADEVSRLAGRGVGMDVVASEVRQLGGTLDIALASRARAPTSPCACRRRWRSPRRCSSASAIPASRCRSPRCAASAASPASELDKPDATLPLRWRGLRAARPRHAARPCAGQGRRPAADAAAADPLGRPARGGHHRPGASATAKSWSSRSARRSPRCRASSARRSWATAAWW